MARRVRDRRPPRKAASAAASRARARGLASPAALLEGIFQSTTDLIWSVDAQDHRLLVYSAGFEQYFRTVRGIEVALGDVPEDLLPPEHAERWRAMFRRVARDGPFETFNEAYDVSRTFHLRLWPVLVDGAAAAIVVFGRDVSALREAERALEQSEARFRLLVEEAPAAFAVVRGLDTAYANRACRRLFGLPEDGQSIGMPVTEYLAPASRLEVAEYHRRRLAGEPVPAEYEVTGFRSGVEFPMRVSIALLEFPDGPTTLAVLTDLTAVKQAERALAEKEAFFRTVLEASPDVALVLGPDRRYRYVSPSMGNMFGWTEQEILELADFSAHVHPQDADRVESTVQELLRQAGSVARLSCRLLAKDGSYRDMEIMARSLIDDPGIQGVVVNARDVSDRRALEEQLRQAQRLESLGRLAGGVAHDFNNVLTVILSSADDLRRQATAGADVRDDAEQIYRAGERARDLTRQLLAFARRQAVASEPLDLNRLLENSRRMLERVLGEGVTLVLRLAPDLWPVCSDPAQLDQVLLNLVANARDAMPRGGRVELATRNVELGTDAVPGAPPGPYVQLEVSDQGVGMSPEVMARIFDPFFTTKDVGRGTGLGLATVHGIVSQNKGHVRVESEPGKGTRFRLLFPRSAERPAEPSGEAGAARVRGGTEMILLVEDDLAVRRRALHALAEAGYEVDVAGDGVEALELAQVLGRTPDLLLTDVVMPRMDGPALAEALREKWPSLRVLFTSGYTDDRLGPTGVLSPGIELLQKPFTGSALLARVRTVLDRPAA